jgi:hypothetical protein
MIYATVRNTTGGYHGHQLKDLIGGIAAIRVLGYKYYHSVYPYLEFFGLGFREPTTAEIPEDIDFTRIGGPSWNGVSFENLQKKFGHLENIYINSKFLVSIENAMRVFPCQTITWYKNGLIKDDVFNTLLTEISSKFEKKHKDRQTRYSKDKIHIAIHIARGSSFDKEKFPEHFTNSKNVRFMFSIDYFEEIINQIKKVKTTKPKQFHIYTEKLNSEEVVSRFSDKKDIKLHIGDNREIGNIKLIQDIFFHFVESDVLVTCNSSFSVMAAYFRSKKTTIYHPHHHLFDLPDENFIPTKQNGEFNSKILEKYLASI